MNHAMKQYLAACLAAFALAAVSVRADAGVGMTEIAGAPNDGPVTVFYPSRGQDAPVKRGPYTLMLDERAEPVRGNGRLVVISHGSGGNAWVHSDLARALVNAGFVVAMPEHQSDNAKDPSQPGPESWKRRPAEVSRAIDAVAKDARFASLVAFDKVGMYGMSAGGHTALSLAGGTWSPGNLLRHCEAHIDDDFPSCVGLASRLRGNVFDGVKKTVALWVIKSRLTDDAPQTYADPRIAAVVAGVPFAVDFDPASLATPRVPLGLVTAGQDKWLAPRYHSDRIAAACKTCERIADMPAAGHGALISPPPPADRIPEILADLLADGPGFDRKQLPEVDRKIAAFFTRHLLP
jgi:predicted dienelactone hydrolase